MRTLIEQNPQKVIEEMKTWAKENSKHTRRAASESLRSRLPWAKYSAKLDNHHQEILEVLEILKTDPEPYVQKSVANNLNDISKNHPQAILQTAQNWKNQNKNNPTTHKILKQGLRTLLKQNNPQALQILQYNQNPKDLTLTNTPKIKPQYQKNEQLTIQTQIKNNTNNTQKLLTYIKIVWPNGKKTKIYQTNEKTLQPKTQTITNKTINLKNGTTITWTEGTYKIEIQINGTTQKTLKFKKTN